MSYVGIYFSWLLIYRRNFGHEFRIPKQGTMPVSTCVRKHLISELQLKGCMMLLRHILAALCEMFSVTPVMTNGQVEKDTLHDLQAPRQI
jgi:hypothetical protein